MDHMEHFYIDDKLAEIRKEGFLKYRSKELPTWCPGCGYFGITHALVKACHALSLPNENICVVSGIGCAGRYPIFMSAYGFHTLHGRAVPIASGVKLANEALTVFAVGGDGDILGIGGGHLPHIARKNVDITLFLFDNMIYGLTKGQSSATTPLGQKTNSHIRGNPDAPLNPIALALSHEASFVARGFAGDVDGMEKTFVRAIQHKGFSFVHLITPCVTFDKVNTWDAMRNGYHPIHDSHDTGDWMAAMRLAGDPRNYLGIFYEDKERPAYQEYLRRLHSGAK